MSLPGQILFLWHARHVLKSHGGATIFMFLGEIKSCINHACNEHSGSNDVGVRDVEIQLLVWDLFLVPNLASTMQYVGLGGHFVADEILEDVIQQDSCIRCLCLFEANFFEGGIEIIEDFYSKVQLVETRCGAGVIFCIVISFHL